MVALIPARSGSTRIPDKNIATFFGHPLMAYTIRTAIESRIFDHVIVSSDSREYLHIAAQYGAETILRPDEFAGSLSPDIEWVNHAIESIDYPDTFAILRPTNPFRTPHTIRRAYAELIGDPSADSLVAVRKCTEHPYKMWEVESRRMRPFLTCTTTPPGHELPYQKLPTVYVQSAALEMARSYVIYDGSIRGDRIKPFFMPDYEDHDINTPMDWHTAVNLVESGKVILPEVA